MADAKGFEPLTFGSGGRGHQSRFRALTYGFHGAFMVLALSGCYESTDATAVRYERIAVRSDFDGAVATCRARGGELARVHDGASVSAMVAACAVGLPDDLTPCWTAIPIDRDGPALVMTIAPFQPTLGGIAMDYETEPLQGFYALCEFPLAAP